MPPERHPDHEGLQVVPTDGLEHSGFTPGLEVATEEGLEYHAVKDVNNYPEVVPVPVPIEEKPASASTICGLKRRTFWIVLGIAVVAIILAAVLGGVLASKKSAGAEYEIRNFLHSSRPCYSTLSRISLFTRRRALSDLFPVPPQSHRLQLHLKSHRFRLHPPPLEPPPPPPQPPAPPSQPKTPTQPHASRSTAQP